MSAPKGGRGGRGAGRTGIASRIKKLAALKGYQKPEKLEGALKLDSNENFVISKRTGQDALSYVRANADIREYPLGLTDPLVSALARYLRVPRSMISVGNGSDQILDLILSNIALPAEARILTPDPTFSFFEERCTLYDLDVTRIPFSADMTLDLEKFEKRTPASDILYLDSPNNPTGFQFSPAQIESLITRMRDGIVIIDEAYGEFARSSAVRLARKYDNLIVTKTFSKAFGMAGLRLGYMIASPGFTDLFTRVLQHPYPVNTAGAWAALALLERSRQMREIADTIKSERRRIIESLRRHDAFEVFDSQANFVLFDAGGAYKRVYTALAEQGISIRKLGPVGGHHGGCLRVTVGTRDMNSRFLLAIRDLLG